MKLNVALIAVCTLVATQFSPSYARTDSRVPQDKATFNSRSATPLAKSGPTLEQAVIRAMAASAGRSLFFEKVRVSHAKSIDGSLIIRFSHFGYDNKKKVQHIVPVLEAAYRKRNSTPRLSTVGQFREKASSVGRSARDSKVCRSVAKACERWFRDRTCPKYFDVEARELKSGDVRFGVRLIPNEPGQSFYFGISDDMRVISVDAGT